jgi:hypothetical protein
MTTQYVGASIGGMPRLGQHSHRPAVGMTLQTTSRLLQRVATTAPQGRAGQLCSSYVVLPRRGIVTRSSPAPPDTTSKDEPKDDDKPAAKVKAPSARPAARRAATPAQRGGSRAASPKLGAATGIKSLSSSIASATGELDAAAGRWLSGDLVSWADGKVCVLCELLPLVCDGDDLWCCCACLADQVPSVQYCVDLNCTLGHRRTPTSTYSANTACE